MAKPGFEKIEFGSNQEEDREIKTGKPKKSSFFRSKKFIIPVIVILVIGVFSVITGIKAQKAYKSGLQLKNQAKIAYEAAKKQNVVLASAELKKTQQDIDILQKDIDDISYLGYIPLVNYYYNDIKHLLNASSYGVSAAVFTADSLIPYADVLGLKGEKSFIEGSAQDRIRIAVKTMGKVVPKIDEIESELTKAKEEVDQIDPNRYPDFWKFKTIREQIVTARALADNGIIAVEQGKPLIKVLPKLLGESEQKKYLVLFQNDKELRPTGGFITFYAVFRVEEGVIRIDSSSDIYNLDKSIRSHPPAPEIILDYLPKVYTLNIRDSNLSPDFVESMKTFNSLYEKSSMKTDIDGIIALDTNVLVSFLSILGEVSAGGTTFHSKIDKRCDCPQVVYVLEQFADQPVNRVREDRKAILGDLLYATMQKALSSSPKLYWGKLFQQALKDIEEKHIIFYLNDKDAQKGLEALNWAGRIKEYSGDYLHINDANFAGAKANMYVKQSVKMEYDIADNGEVNKTITVTYKNPYPHSDCNLERGGLCLNATLRDFVRVYVPKGSVLLSSKGSEVKVGTKEDLGKTVFEGFLTVKPLGKSETVYKYKLPFKLEKNSTLPVMIQKQPGTGTIPYELYVNGKKVEAFNLIVDKELILKP